jgi:hypothetical protein
VTLYFNNTKNYDDCGFQAHLPMPDIEHGKYEIGIYIEKEGMKAYNLSGKVVELPY